MWDSQKTFSNVSQNVAYSGSALVAATGYSWSVRWWDTDNVASDTAVASFSTGLYTEADWHGVPPLNCKHFTQ